MKKLIAALLMSLALIAMPLTVMADVSPTTTPNKNPGTSQTSAKTGDELFEICGVGAAALAGVAFVAARKRREA